MKPRFSIASYSFHGLMGQGIMNVFHYLETVRYRYGMTTADIWNGMLENYEEGYLQKIKMMLDEHDLCLENLCCDRCHVWADTPQEREITEKVAEDCLRAGEILGAKTVRIDLGVGGDRMTEEQLEHSARKYEEYCRRAAGFGAKLGPENHWGASTNVTEMRKLFDAVNAPNFGLLLHLGNWQKSEDTSREAILANDIEFAPKAMHMHIMYEVALEAEDRLPALIEAGYQGCFGVEHHKSTDEFQGVALQLAHVKRVVDPLSYKREGGMPKAEDLDAATRALFQKAMQ